MISEVQYYKKLEINKWGSGIRMSWVEFFQKINKRWGDVYYGLESRAIMA